MNVQVVNTSIRTSPDYPNMQQRTRNVQPVPQQSSHPLPLPIAVQFFTRSGKIENAARSIYLDVRV